MLWSWSVNKKGCCACFQGRITTFLWQRAEADLSKHNENGDGLDQYFSVFFGHECRQSVGLTWQVPHCKESYVYITTVGMVLKDNGVFAYWEAMGFAGLMIEAGEEHIRSQACSQKAWRQVKKRSVEWKQRHLWSNRLLGTLFQIRSRGNAFRFLVNNVLIIFRFVLKGF